MGKLVAVEDHYVLTIPDLAMHGEVSISSDQYHELKVARGKVLAALRIEESFEVVVSTYIRFERYLLEQSLEQMVRQTMHSYDTFTNLRLEVNVLLSAFLAAAKHYRDTVPQNLRKCTDNFQKEVVDKCFSNEYDAAFEFRFMEAMRNYAQHSALPVDSALVHGHRNADDGQTRFMVNVFSTKRALGSSFKAEIRKEMPERVDLRRCARFYLQGLARAQREIRALSSSSTMPAFALINRTRQLYEGPSVNRHGLAAVHYHGCDVAGQVSLSVEPNGKRLELQRRNENASAVGSGYVSNELIPLSEIPPPDEREFG